MADIHEHMEDAGGESREKEGQWRNLSFRLSVSAQEKRESDKQAEKEGCHQRMKIGPIESEENRRTEIRAQRIDVGESPGDEHRNRDDAREPGKSGALQRIGS